MSIKDFRAKQVRASALIASGGLGVSGKTDLGLLIYSSSAATNLTGGRMSTMLDDVGTDVWLFVSGTSNNETFSVPGVRSGEGVTLFGGDVVVSGTFYAERVVMEVDQTSTGSLMVSGSLFVSQSVSIGQISDMASDLSNAGVLDLRGNVNEGKPTLFINHEDDDVIGIDLNINNTTAAGIDLDSTSTTGNVIDVAASNLTTGRAKLTTATATPADGASNTIEEWDIDFDGTGTSTGKGLFVNYDKDGITASGKTATVYGVQVDVDDSATNVGTVNLYGLEATATAASTNGTITVYGANISAAGGDTNIGLQVTSVDKALRLKHDDEEYADFSVSSTGGLTIATSDDSSDSGAITLDTVDKITLDSDTAGEGIVYADGGTELLQIHNDGSQNVILKVVNNNKSFIFHDDTANVLLQLGESVGAIFNDQAISSFDFRVEGQSGNQGAILFDAGTTQIALLSNGTSAANAFVTPSNTTGRAIPSDVSLWISGAMGGRGITSGDAAKGVAVFAGDIVSSGTTALGLGLTMPGSAPTQQSLIVGAHSITGSDISIFFSGSKGQKSAVNSYGTALFGGDVVISGSLFDADGAEYRSQATGSFNEVPVTGEPNSFVTTASLSLAGELGMFHDVHHVGTDVYFFVSGTVSETPSGGTGGKAAVFGGDLVVSGGLVVSGTVTATQSAPVYIGASGDDGTNNPMIELRTDKESGSSIDRAIEISANKGIIHTDAGYDLVTAQGTGGITTYVGGRGYDIQVAGTVSTTPKFTVTVEESTSDTSIWLQSADGGIRLLANGGDGYGKVLVESATATDADSIELKSTAGGMLFDLNATSGKKVHFDVESTDADSIHLDTKGGIHSFAETDISIQASGSLLLSGSQVLILSGAGVAAESMQPAQSNDINLFVSGAIGSRGTSVRGTSVFGGDLVVSGGLHVSGSAEFAPVYIQAAGDGSPFGDANNAMLKLAVPDKQSGAAADIAMELSTPKGMMKFDAGLNNNNAGMLFNAGGRGIQIRVDSEGVSPSPPNAVFDVRVTEGPSASSILLQTVDGGMKFDLDKTSGKRVHFDVESTDDDSIFLDTQGGIDIDVGSNKEVNISNNLEVGNSIAVANAINHVGESANKINFTTGQVLILSGGAEASPNSAAGADVAFHVSGAIGLRGTSERGTSVFGGDLFVSGALVVGAGRHTSGVESFNGGTISGSIHETEQGISYLVAGSNITIASGTNGQITISSTGGGGGGDVDVSGTPADNQIAIWTDADTLEGTSTLTYDGTTIHLNDAVVVNEAGGDNDFRVEGQNNEYAIFSDANTDQLVFGSNKAPGASGGPPTLGNDVGVFISGTIGGIGVTAGDGAKGSTVVGGDLFVSGVFVAKNDGVDGGSISGSIHETSDGISYLVAGENVSITSASNGQITIGASLGGGSVDTSGTPANNQIAIFTDENTIEGTSTLTYDGSTINLNDSVVVNEGGGDNDFRVESSNEQYAFHVDAALDMVQVLSSSAEFHQDKVLILSGGVATDPDESRYPDTNFFVSGSVGSRSTSDRGTSLFGGDVTVSGSVSVNPGKENVTTSIFNNRNGSAVFKVSSAGVIINEAGDSNNDFRVESDNNGYMLFVDAGNDRLGIGATGNSPATTVHVKDSSPTLRIQRSSNSQDASLDFAGSGGSIGAAMLLSSSNDLVFKTHDGTSPHEILRLGGHYSSDVRQVILLSGSDMASSAMQPKEAIDINFFVSGAVGSRGTSTRGTSVFGGDLFVSGALHTEQPIAIVHNSTSTDALLITSTENGSDASPIISLKRNSASPANADYLGQVKFKGENDNDEEIVYAKITGKIGDKADGAEDGIIEFTAKNAGSNTIIARVKNDGFAANSFKHLGESANKVDFNTGQVLILSGGAATSANTAGGADVAFFVSGAIGSIGSSVKGSSVFGGDLFTSGTMVVLSNGVDGGSISGSIHETAEGKSYLVAGSNVTITSGTNGQVTIAATAGSVSVANDSANRVITTDADGSFTAEAALSIDSSIVTLAGNIEPDSDMTRNLGAEDKRFSNIYTGDLHLKNERGDWSIVEEEEYLSITNNKTGKKYKFVLEEIE